VIILIFFILFHFVLGYFSPSILPYIGFFPYKEHVLSYHLPEFISAFANFDGAQYVRITSMGYQEYTQAYFPLYPTLMKMLGIFLGGNYLLSGLLISLFSFISGVYIFKKYLQLLFNDPKTIRWVVGFLLVFPTSFFFISVYTESLFLLLTISVLFLMKKKQYIFAAILAYFAALTRLNGLFLVIPILIEFLSERLPQPHNSSKINHLRRLRINSFAHLIPNFKLLITNFSLTKIRDKKQLTTILLHLPKYILLLSPILGLMTYCFYLWQTTGDPFFFFTSQPVFGANRSTSIILLPQVTYRYIKIFLSPLMLGEYWYTAFNYQYYIALIEFIIFHFIFIILLLDFYNVWKKKYGEQTMTRLGLNLFSMITIVLPTLTGTFSSIPRYALMAISAFIFLGEVRHRWLKILIATVFVYIHIVLFVYFILGNFVG
jgi:hypothetical protein